MNYQQQIKHLRRSRGLIVVCLISAVLGLTTAFIAVQAEAASIGIVVSAEYINSDSIEQSNKNFAVASSILTSDDFDNCSLDTDLWTYVDPLGDGAVEVTRGKAMLSVPAGVNHDPWTTNESVRIMQTANDVDFEMEVKFDSPLNEQYQMQGILVEEDATNYLRLEFHSTSSNTRIYVAGFADGSVDTKVTNVITGTGEVPLYMRVGRLGENWTQSYSFNGQNWTTGVSFTHTLAVSSAGVFVGNFGGPAHTAVVDYFYNTAAPGTGDVAKTLTVNSVGQGTVSKDPNKSSYDCNDVVELEATPATGWSFSSWSGDVISTANPVSLTITSSQIVTATFTQDEYALDVNTVGDGTVDKSPNQATYHYSDVVTLTATADTGWSFSSWSGDATGSSNPEQVTIDGNKVVTATFTQDEYTLDVNTVGDGTVDKSPNQATYHYSDVVTLTATADTGWSFSSWSGDATGSSNPEQVTIDGNKVVTATFTQDEYTLDVNTVGDGTVDKSPNQATYHYSDVVTLTATADTGWSFSSWSGDLISSDNPETLIIVGNTTITATFSTEEEYTIFIPLVITPLVGAADLVVDELLVSNIDIQANDPDQLPSPLIEIWTLLES